MAWQRGRGQCPIERQDFRQARQLARVHVGRRLSDIAQARCCGSPAQFVVRARRSLAQPRIRHSPAGASSWLTIRLPAPRITHVQFCASLRDIGHESAISICAASFLGRCRVCGKRRLHRSCCHRREYGCGHRRPDVRAEYPRRRLWLKRWPLGPSSLRRCNQSMGRRRRMLSKHYVYQYRRFIRVHVSAGAARRWRQQRAGCTGCSGGRRRECPSARWQI